MSNTAETEQQNDNKFTKTLPCAPTSEIHANFHAKSQIVGQKSSLFFQNQSQTMRSESSILKSNFFLPYQIQRVRDQILEIRTIDDNSSKYEDTNEWFQGRLILGHKFGYGKFYRKKKFYYEGGFLNNLKHGKGLLVQEDGTFQHREFFADKLLGESGMFQDFEDDCAKNDELEDSKLEFPNGAVYKGQVLDGKRHGKGSYVWKDGTKYEGSFFDDKFHGFGVMEYADGKKYRGEWYEGEMQGIGHFTWPDKQEYKGSYVGSKKDGLGVFKYKSGITYIGYFKNGLNHGKALITQINHKPQISFWEDGKRIE